MPRNQGMKYPLIFTAMDAGELMIESPDFPELTSVGEDEDAALLEGLDAIESAIMARMDDRKPVPAPSRIETGAPFVVLPAVTAAKVALYQAMMEEGIRKSALAREMGVHMPQVDRLLDLRHASRMDQLERALECVGKRLTVGVEPIAA